MSLHLGNLSSRIRRDELERIFRRFGRCSVRIKDKFGFVVYQYPENAEKALGTLRGTRICGERITLSWSKKQPHPSHTLAQRRRNFEQLQGRHFAQKDYTARKSGFAAREGHTSCFREADVCRDLIDGTKARLNDMEDYTGQRHHGSFLDMHDEGDHFETNKLRNDWWGKQINENDLENGLDFDRYEPCLDDDVKLQGIPSPTHLDLSPPVRKYQEKPVSDQVHHQALESPNNPKPARSCQLCGEVGHRMRKCPKQLKRLETRSGLHLDRDQDVMSRGWHKSDIEPSPSRNPQRLLDAEDFLETRLTHPGMENDYREKKRSSKENETSDKQQEKKARVPVSSSIHSDYTASGSQSPSRSQRSFSGCHTRSRSKSIASTENSLSSCSMSGSTSSRPRRKKTELWQISRSSSPTSLSLSVSLDRALHSSPNKMQINQYSLVSSSGFEQGPIGVENESSVAPIKPEDNEKNSRFLRKDDTNSIMGRMIEMNTYCLPQSEISSDNPGTFASKVLTEIRESETDDFDFVRKNTLMQMKNSDVEASQRSTSASLMSVSPKEMWLVLKNCGQKHLDEIEEDLRPEVYFSSARFWPWEIIYYRRLRKGPISKENYARRLSQNQEFGISDRYIRSSSGWGEMTDECP